MALDVQVHLSAEEAVLGAALLEPGRAPEVAASLQAGDLVDSRNRCVFEAIYDLVSRSVGVDLITVGEELGRRGTFQAVGGHSRLVELTGKVTSASHLRHHMRIVGDHAALRRVRRETQDILSEAAGLTPMEGDVAEFLDRSVERIVAASSRSTIGGPEFVDREVGSLRERIAAGPADGLDGQRTGYRDLDQIICGARGGDLVVVGARPSIGKSAILAGICLNALREDGCLPLLFYSLEMPKAALVERMAATISGVDHYLIRTRRLVGSNLDRVNEALAEIQSMRLAIDEVRAQTILSIRASARKFKQQHGLGFIVVDYLQLIEHRGSENRLGEVSAVSRGLKTLARELDVPVIAAAQLNRSADTQDRPLLSNLRESGTIESDADIVILLHQVDGNVGTSEPREVEAIVAKNRNGPVGTATLLFQPNVVRFVDLDDGVPNAAGGPHRLTTATAQIPGLDEGGEYHAQPH